MQIWNNTQKNVDKLFRLRCSRYRQTPNVLKRVMPTPIGVNIYFGSRTLFSNLPIFEQQESKVDVHPICP